MSQAVGGTTTAYLLDVQPELAKVLSETTLGSVTRYVHGQRGLLVQEDASSNWEWMIADGLGSVRGVVNDSLAVQESRLYAPYGEPFGTTGTSQTAFGFTGEQTDANNLVYLRARYHNPEIGAFLSLDPVEGNFGKPLNMNLYLYALANPVLYLDASGNVAYVPDTTLCLPPQGDGGENSISNWISPVDLNGESSVSATRFGDNVCFNERYSAANLAINGDDSVYMYCNGLRSHNFCCGQLQSLSASEEGCGGYTIEEDKCQCRPIGVYKLHPGVDISLFSGDPIRAVADGRVIRIGYRAPEEGEDPYRGAPSQN